NANLRIALRVQDAGDSVDIIDQPSAATIDRSTPGRAYLRRGPSDVDVVQTALASAPRPAGASALSVRPFRLSSSDRGGPERHVQDDDAPNELTMLVDVICAAAGDAA